jgi:sortase A
LSRALRHVGELLIALGILLASYAAYELWFSNFESRAAGQALAVELQQEWLIAPSGPADAAEEPNGNQAPIEDQPQAETRPLPKPIGLLYIPRLKSDVWQTPLLENVSDRALTLGVGHYASTAQPGQPGNFAIAGHRATFGEPFARIERLKVGDEIIVQTETQWHVYRLIADRIVQPDENWVLARAPEIPELAGAQSIITVTTCEPRFNSTERWVWFGELVETLPADSPPKSIGGQP